MAGREDAQPKDCPTTECSAAFDRVLVDYVVEGGGRVSWILADDFAEAGPYIFQLQVGKSGVSTAEDWEAVGAPAVDVNFMVDDEKRVYGQTMFTHYRVCMQTGVGIHFSKPTPVWGRLTFREWRLSQEIIRQEKLNFREGGIEGLFLKRKLFGEPCSCLDFQTKEIKRPDCDECYGTGFAGGYWPAVDCVNILIDPKTHHEELDGGQSRGTINDIFTQARMLAQPFMNEEDVWVDRNTDDRWFIHRVQNIAEKNGYPLVAKVELRHAPYSHVIYKYPVPKLTDEPPASTLPDDGGPDGPGTGSVAVDENYGGANELLYVNQGQAVVGAEILAYPASDYAAGNRLRRFAVAVTTTGTAGAWEPALQLDPNDYVFQFYKQGFAGPDAFQVEVF